MDWFNDQATLIEFSGLPGGLILYVQICIFHVCSSGKSRDCHEAINHHQFKNDFVLYTGHLFSTSYF